MLYTLLAAILAAAPMATGTEAPAAASQQAHKTVSGDELKSWYDQKKPMAVLDARTKEYFDGMLLPDAKWLPYDSTEVEIMKAVPDKEMQVVVYCAGPKCPASGWLYDKLINMGYVLVHNRSHGFGFSFESLNNFFVLSQIIF